MNSAPSPLVAVRHLVKHFPARAGGGKVVKAVDDVSFELSAGETLALVGESGCGKSTTGRLVLRLIEPTRERAPSMRAGVPAEWPQSRILFQGADVSAMDRAGLLAYRRQAQIIFQDPFSSLNPRMTVGQIIGEPLVVHRAALARDHASEIAGRFARQERVGDLLKLVGLNPEHAHRHPHEFSGGQRQRIGIARALALQPKLIVCDEPVSALDVSVQAQIINLLADLQQQLGVAYLFISHNLAIVRHLAHRVAVMYLGRIVELGATEQVFAAPRHPYTQALLSAVPVPDPTHARDRVRLEGEAASPVDVPAGCRFHPRCPHTQPVCREEDPRLSGRAGESQAACHLANGHERFV